MWFSSSPGRIRRFSSGSVLWRAEVRLLMVGITLRTIGLRVASVKRARWGDSACHYEIRYVRTLVWDTSTRTATGAGANGDGYLLQAEPRV
jgi:hypothetical protein